ncbi:MAG: DUF2288 family protein [Bdellovibrionales bacterium]|nr:DUF2288 family protein [Bdellovibrionales bacterium]
MSQDKLLKTMKENIQEGQWHWIAPHQERGAVIVVSQDLDLAEVGVKVSVDSVPEVSEWVKKGDLARPTEKQLEEWNETPGRHFRFLIVQPYVLIQVLGH